jgi:hypothetical protein
MMVRPAWALLLLPPLPPLAVAVALVLLLLCLCCWGTSIAAATTGPPSVSRQSYVGS